MSHTCDRGYPGWLYLNFEKKLPNAGVDEICELLSLALHALKAYFMCIYQMLTTQCGKAVFAIAVAAASFFALNLGLVLYPKNKPVMLLGKLRARAL